jgi:hypothetical protein
MIIPGGLLESGTPVGFSDCIASPYMKSRKQLNTSRKSNKPRTLFYSGQSPMNLSIPTNNASAWMGMAGTAVSIATSVTDPLRVHRLRQKQHRQREINIRASGRELYFAGKTDLDNTNFDETFAHFSSVSPEHLGSSSDS